MLFLDLIYDDNEYMNKLKDTLKFDGEITYMKLFMIFKYTRDLAWDVFKKKYGNWHTDDAMVFLEYFIHDLLNVINLKSTSDTPGIVEIDYLRSIALSFMKGEFTDKYLSKNDQKIKDILTEKEKGPVDQFIDLLEDIGFVNLKANGTPEPGQFHTFNMYDTTCGIHTTRNGYTFELIEDRACFEIHPNNVKSKKIFYPRIPQTIRFIFNNLEEISEIFSNDSCGSSYASLRFGVSHNTVYKNYLNFNELEDKQPGDCSTVYINDAYKLCKFVIDHFYKKDCIKCEFIPVYNSDKIDDINAYRLRVFNNRDDITSMTDIYFMGGSELSTTENVQICDNSKDTAGIFMIYVSYACIEKSKSIITVYS